MILAILLTVTTLAVKPREPTCTEVAIAARLYGEAAVEAEARRRGFTTSDIERIRKRCKAQSG